MQKGGWVYFMANQHNNVLYVGVTSELNLRVQQHKAKANPKSFTAKYNCDKLVYFESYASIEEAISREKNIKNWKREWKDQLVNKSNPKWIDLSEGIEE
jgi:putative endonuclease